MMAASELVFEGQVVDVVSKLDTDGGGIHTFVTFQILRPDQRELFPTQDRIEFSWRQCRRPHLGNFRYASARIRRERDLFRGDLAT